MFHYTIFLIICLVCTQMCNLDFLKINQEENLCISYCSVCSKLIVPTNIDESDINEKYVGVCSTEIFF